MQLLIAVINEEEKVEEVLAGLLELGVTGATVINSEGMGRLLTSEVPIFAGLEALSSRTRPRNQTIFSLIEDDAKTDEAVALIEQVCGGMDAAGRGIVFTVPVTRARGISPEIGAG